MEMTPRQRWQALLENKKPDRIPTDYQANPEVTKRLMRDLDCSKEEDLWQELHIDKRKWVEAKWKHPHHIDIPGADYWGVCYEWMPHETGAYPMPVHQPLIDCDNVDQVHTFRWPDPDDFDYEGMIKELDEDDGYYPIHCSIYEPFLIYASMRSMENAFTDLAVEPDIADAVLGHIVDFYYEYHRRMFEAAGKGRIDTTFVAEDLGGQTGPLMSLETYRRYLRDNQTKMADLARSFDIHVMYHTDGASRTFLPDLVDVVGIEILDPIQWRCPGMSREELVRDFGDKIIFHGSIDNQETLSFGSVDDVISEVRESVEIYRNARWICAPCHNVQTITPTENVVAMFHTIHQIGTLT